MQNLRSNKSAWSTHNVKCDERYYKSVVSGVKTAELRFNDRDYKVGDKLILWEWDGSDFTERHCALQITHILTSDEFIGLTEDYVMLSFKPFLQ